MAQVWFNEFWGFGFGASWSRGLDLIVSSSQGL